MGILQQVEGIAEALLDGGAVRLPFLLLPTEARQFGVEAPLVREEQVAGDGVGVVGVNLFDPLLVDRLPPVEGGEHDLLDALALVGVQLNRAVQVFNPLLDFADWQSLALLAGGVAASVADEVFVGWSWCGCAARSAACRIRGRTPCL